MSFIEPPPQNFINHTAKIGSGTTIWHFAVVLADVVIGENCSIGSGAEIGRGSSIGSGTRIGHGTFLPPHSQIGENVFVGPGVVFTDDKYPRVNHVGYNAQPPTVEDGAVIGAGAVILPGVRLGCGSMVGAGAIVTRDVPANTTVRCEPARKQRTTD